MEQTKLYKYRVECIIIDGDFKHETRKCIAASEDEAIEKALEVYLNFTDTVVVWKKKNLLALDCGALGVLAKAFLIETADTEECETLSTDE